MKTIVSFVVLLLALGCCCNHHDKCQDEKMCCSPDKNHNTITEQTSKDDLCRYLNSTCIGPYDFSDKGYSEIVATMLADARQNLTASGSEYSIGLSGGVDVTQEGRVVKIQVPKLPILDAFCLVAGHFNAVATYQIGCIWIRPKANAKRMPLSVREVEVDESKMNQLNGSPVPVCSSPTNTNSGLFGEHDELVAKGLVAIKTIKMPKMTFDHKPLSDILSSVYKQCNLRLTEEWGFGVGLTYSGVDLNERYSFEIPELTIYEVFLFIAQRVGANVRYEDGRIYMEGLRDERN